MIRWDVAGPYAVVFTTREGGVSDGAFASLNLGLATADRPEHVHENRRRLRAALSLPTEPRWLEQVHGTRVLDLDREQAGAADGAVTTRPGVVCAVLTADCLPVLLCDRAGSHVGVAHAGWRGLLNGVLPAAVAAFGGPKGDLVAWLGPAIGPAAYEVGADVRDAFLMRSPAAERRFEPNGRGRWQADLYGLARDALAAVGVVSVHGGGFCTHTEAGRFFSHRREAPCGRMATLIWLAAKPDAS